MRLWLIVKSLCKCTVLLGWPASQLKQYTRGQIYIYNEYIDIQKIIFGLCFFRICLYVPLYELKTTKIQRQLPMWHKWSKRSAYTYTNTHTKHSHLNTYDRLTKKKRQKWTNCRVCLQLVDQYNMRSDQSFIYLFIYFIHFFYLSTFHLNFLNWIFHSPQRINLNYKWRYCCWSAIVNTNMLIVGMIDVRVMASNISIPSYIHWLWVFGA